MRFTTSDAAQLANVTQRQIRYWNKNGLVIPSGKSTGWRSYTFQDIVALRTVSALREQKCSIQTIRRAIEYLRKNYPDADRHNPPSSLILIGDGNRLFLRHGADKLEDVLSGQLAVWLVPLGRIIADAQRQAHQLPTAWAETVKVLGRPYTLDITRDPDVGGFNVQCRELPGAVEQGESVEEAVANGKAAIESAVHFMRRRDAITSKVKSRRAAIGA
jgi:DNA-binding transcriptional MerR regulator/predicted RNase H-like HicB family nuclease